MRALCLVGICTSVGLAPPPASAHGGKVLAKMPCPVEEPMGIAIVGEHFYISDLRTRTLVQVRKSDGVVVESLATPGFMPTGLAWHDGILYAADRRMETIARRRLAAEADEWPIPYFETWAFGMTHDGEHLWVVDARAAKLHEIDPADGTTMRSFAAPAKRPTGLAFDGRYLWVADHQEDEIYRVEPETGSVVAIMKAPGPYPSALVADGDSLWVADYEQRTLYRVALPGDTPYVEDDERRVRASYEVLYRAKDGEVTALVAYVAVPREIPGQHILSELSFTPEPTRFETDRWGQKVAVFEIDSLAAGQTTSVGWDGDFALFRTRFQIVPERVARLPHGLDAYLVDDKKYDLSTKVVTELVDRLVAGQTGTYGKARAIYEHLTEVISYDRSSGWNNAAAVLERGTGSCSEYTFALVALLRRAGVPARYVGAISERGGEASFDDVFHRWAEAYLPGYGWVPIDANAGHGKPPGERGGFFGGRSNRHVVTTIGGGASEYLEWGYNSYETYRPVGNARLEIQPIARFRPLDSQTAVEVHEAPRVPRLVEAPASQPALPGEASTTRPWLAGLALLVALGIGIGIGRLARRS